MEIWRLQEKKSWTKKTFKKKAKDFMTATQKEQQKVKLKLAKMTQATKNGTSNNFNFCCH